MPQADPERVAQEIEEIIGLEVENIHQVSAKTGEGVDALLGFLIENIPPPSVKKSNHLQALIVDSWFDNYL